jgi:Protein of unknown function (DUF3500)
MDRRTFVTLMGTAATSALLQSSASFADSPGEPMLGQTVAIVKATTAFLNLLTPEQRDDVQFPFSVQPSATAAHFKGGLGGNVTFTGELYGQSMWSNFPVSDVPRPGLRLGSLSSTQRDAAMQLLQTLLSPMGYQKVLDIMGSDQALANGGTNFAAGRDVYTIGIFGVPSSTSPWMVQFGGHHLGLNVTMIGERGVLAPVLTGAQPAAYTENGRTTRALNHENDTAFDLLNSLDEEQYRQAIIEHDVSELVLGPGHDGEMPAPVGVKASAMDQRQRLVLMDLISQWACIVNDIYAAPRLVEIKATLDDTYFAWSGPTTHEPERNGASYFRVQGPKVFIEFSPQQPGGDLTQHVHTIYRDPTNAYGRASIARLNGTEEKTSL